MQSKKEFKTYQEQISFLEKKGLKFIDQNKAVEYLKRYSYYSLVSGYKDIFIDKSTGRYTNKYFEDIVALYLFDEFIRNIFLFEIIKIEQHIKSLYSYSFCSLYGDTQSDYLNVNNYNYKKYQNEIKEFISKVNGILSHSNNYKYINHYVTKYSDVPLWVLIKSLTFGSLSKMYTFSNQKLQSRIAHEFDYIYDTHLSTILAVLTKFRNVCAHGERLYNYKTNNSIRKLPIHNKIFGYTPKCRNDLFNVYLSFKYLLNEFDFSQLSKNLQDLLDGFKEKLGDEYTNKVLSAMGFPKNWRDAETLSK